MAEFTITSTETSYTQIVTIFKKTLVNGKLDFEYLNKTSRFGGIYGELKDIFECIREMNPLPEDITYKIKEKRFVTGENYTKLGIYYEITVKVEKQNELSLILPEYFKVQNELMEAFFCYLKGKESFDKLKSE